MHYRKLLVGFLINVAKKPRQLEIENADRLIEGFRRVDERTEHIEKGFHPKLPADRCNRLHRRMKQRRVQKTYIRLVQRAVNFVLRVTESIAKILHHIQAATSGRYPKHSKTR